MGHKMRSFVNTGEVPKRTNLDINPASFGYECQGHVDVSPLQGTVQGGAAGLVLAVEGGTGIQEGLDTFQMASLGCTVESRLVVLKILCQLGQGVSRTSRLPTIDKGV